MKMKIKMILKLFIIHLVTVRNFKRVFLDNFQIGRAFFSQTTGPINLQFCIHIRLSFGFPIF